MARKKRGKEQNEDESAPVIQFSAAELTYNESEFVNPAHDDHGQSTKVVFRCSPITERNLEIVRDDKRFPYKTVSDVVRHAVIRHLHFLHRIQNDMPKHMLAGLDAVLTVCRDAEMRAHLEETFVQLDRLIDQALERDDRPEALRLMTLSKQQITAMPESHWKQGWLDRFARKYAHYLTIAEPVAGDNVVPFPEERNGSED